MDYERTVINRDHFRQLEPYLRLSQLSLRDINSFSYHHNMAWPKDFKKFVFKAKKFADKLLKDNNLTHVMADHGFMRLGAKWNDARTEEYLFWFIIIGKARAFEQNNRSWAWRMKAKKLHEIFG